MGSMESIGLAIGRAKHMIVNNEIGEDAHGEVWIKVEDGWRRLDRLIQGALKPEAQAAWEWLGLALTALDLAQELDELPQRIEVPGMIRGHLDLYRLK